MSIEQYRQQYGADFKRHESEPWLTHLLALFESEHPLKDTTKNKADNLLLQGAPVYLNQIIGYEKAMQILKDVREEVKPRAEEPPSNYPPEEAPKE